MSSELVWQIVRKHTAFTKRGLHGLVNSKAIDLQAGEGNTLVLTKNTKAAKNPTKALKKVELKKRHARQLKAVAAEVQNVRPDLKTAALRRASALHKAQVKQAATA